MRRFQSMGISKIGALRRRGHPWGPGICRWTAGAGSISARDVCAAAGRADIESAPTEVCRGARFQFWKHPCFENAAKRPPALPRAGGAAFVFFLRVSRTPAPARRCGPKFRQGRRPFSGAGATKKWPLSKRPLFLEVTTRFELVNEGFADPCLTTWLQHHMERLTRLELATSTLARWRSTR